MSEPPEEIDDLELQALQRELDGAFESTRPRPGFEDELWLQVQSARPPQRRFGDVIYGLFQGIREVPAVPLAAVAATLVVVLGVGLFAYSGLGRGGAGGGASQGMSSEANAPRNGALFAGNFGRLPTPVFNNGTKNGQAPAAAVDSNNRITLIAEDHNDTIGTMSIGFDRPEGLFVDDLFPAEVEALRREGRRICEFTKLAVDGVVRSKRVLASLFHVAYIYAHRLKGFDCLLIEVNPRHVRYYEKMLGFKTIGPERLNRRVNAPAVLLCLDFAHAHAQIERFGGQPELGSVERSLYPYFFSIKEEAGIVGRLQFTALRDVRRATPRRMPSPYRLDDEPLAQEQTPRSAPLQRANALRP